LNFNALPLYISCRATDYGDKLIYGINVTDPGAVPGASTITLNIKFWGRNRIDVRNKDITFAQYDTAVTGQNL
jgi:hypothetical protein